MAGVSESDFEQCVDGLYRVLSDPSRLPEAVSGLRRLFRATGASYIQLDCQGQFRAFVSDGHDPGLAGQFVEHYAALDPTRPGIVRSSAGDWFRDDLLLSPERTPQPEYVHDFSMKAGIRWLRGGKIIEDASGSAFFTVHRPADALPFGDDAGVLLDLLRPHLARVFRLMAELEGALPALASRQAVVDMIATGICVVDGKGLLHYANPAAESILRRPCALHLRRSHVASDDPVVRCRLLEALRRATASHGRAQSFAVAPGTDAEQRLQVRVVPLDAWQSLGGRARLAMMFMTLDPVNILPAELKQLFGLSPSEADLVGLLARGWSPARCAAERNVSMATTRTQLASVYAKARVGSHAELMTLVLRLPGLR